MQTHRPVVRGRNGLVVADHPLAAQAGLEVLRRGGNAVDAAITAAAVLSVVAPHYCGLGGDLFALIYLADKDVLRALNGSGRSPYLASIEAYHSRGMEEMPERGIYSVTVPGTVDAWETALRECGTMSLAEALAPAIEYARGFPMYEKLSQLLARESLWRDADPSLAEIYLPEGEPPPAGQVFVQEELAQTLETIGRQGARAFYQGEIAQAIVNFSRSREGLLGRDDLLDHSSAWTRPISTLYRGYRVYELPPNSQGLALLVTLNLLEDYDLARLHPASADYIHLAAEALKLAFADQDRYIADPERVDIPVEGLLSKAYARERRREIDPRRARSLVGAGSPRMRGGTVYLAVVDGQGNAVSLIQSLCGLFGSGLAVEGTGIVLHNRGASFSLNPRQANRLEPHKRPYEDLNSGLAFRDERLYLLFGTPGRNSQVQTNLQVLNNLLIFGMNPQEAVEAPRFLLRPDGELGLEARISSREGKELAARGHRVVEMEDWDMEAGSAQVILIDAASGVLSAGADPRRDAYAVGW